MLGYTAVPNLQSCRPPWNVARLCSQADVVPIRKVLVANRGEIACRIMRTARKMGVQTVAVFSDADVHSLHVSMADEAYNIGPAPSQESYLHQDRILDVARRAGCQAVHPGYGFLSENTEFAERCQQSGVVFIGPPATAIRDMGIKSRSKAIMTSAGVPVIAGYHGEDQSTERLQMEADQIGFPLMIKAVRGGGGKGMRVARTADEFAVQLASARREALKSFGDDVMLLETFVQHPRHVEVQIFGDHYGNYVHLFERDCSVQRRHQKVIEEAPAPGLSDTLRAELGQAAVRAAQAVAYVGAGTVEFIVDCHTHAFHFMEMNTRLQVEHPVTEMVTGLDLVEWQLQVASGLPLPLRQEEIQVRGHAFEARIYAESPDEDFLPGAGRLHYLASPEAQADVRIETGVRQGDEVSVYYDPMIAKLVVWGDTRQTALQKLRARLTEYNIVGLNTNVDFLVQLSDNPDFLCGEVHTGFIEQHHKQLFPAPSVAPQHLMQAALAVVLHEELQSAAAAICSADPFSPFVLVKGDRLNHLLVRTLTLKHKEKAVPIQVTYLAEKQYGLQIDGSPSPVLMSGSLTKTNQGLNLTCIMDGVCRHSRVVIRDGDIHLFTKDGSCHLTLPEPMFLAEQFSADGLAKDSGVAAPMPGLVDKVFVSKGQSVAMGDPLLVVIAMKMEHVIRAPRAAVVDEVLCQIGDNISKNATVVTFVEQC